MRRYGQARLAALWLSVSAPVAWGVYETVHKAAALFY
jgi:hypothetical protein